MYLGEFWNSKSTDSKKFTFLLSSLNCGLATSSFRKSFAHSNIGANWVENRKSNITVLQILMFFKYYCSSNITFLQILLFFKYYCSSNITVLQVLLFLKERKLTVFLYSFLFVFSFIAPEWSRFEIIQINFLIIGMN